MSSLESTGRTRRSGLRSSTWTTLAAAAGISCLLVGGSARAGLSNDTLTNGTLSLPIGTLQPIVVSQSPASIAPLVSRNGGNELTGLGFPDVIIATTSFIIPVTDPAAAPIKGVQATVMNAEADFNTHVTTMATTMGGTAMGIGFGGVMPLVGFNKVCLFGTCTAAVSNINVPVDVVGIGGNVFVSAAVNLTVIGAPWTTMTVSIGTINKVGGVDQDAVGTNMVVDHVSIVTPVFVSTNIAASAIVPVFGVFNFDVTSTTPEPATIAAMGASIAALVSVGFSRRRK